MLDPLPGSWDFDPLTAPPGGHEDTGQELYQVEIRDGAVFSGSEKVR